MSTPTPDMGSPQRRREIDREIERYRNSLSPVSADKLLSMHMPYLLKWVRFLTTLSPATEDPFRMFLRAPQFRRVPGDQQSKHKLIVDSLRAYEKDDIFSDVCVAFLDACRKSENAVYGTPYYLAQRIYDAIKDPLVFGGRCSIFLHDDRGESGEANSELPIIKTTVDSAPRTDTLERFYREIKESKNLMVPVASDLEEGETCLSFLEDLVTIIQREDGLVGVSLSREWIDGRTTGMGNVPEFAALTREDRELILRFYLIKQRYENIGLDMGITKRRARYLLSRARVRLHQALAENRPEYHVTNTTEL